MPTLKAVIKADGGKGDFTVATLDAAAYEALYNKKADFTIPFTAWEGVEAEERGIDLRYFQFADYGFPEFYQVVLACDREWLQRDPAAAKAFVAATVKGFELAASNPDEAAGILVAQNPGVFDANPDLPRDSQRFLAEGRLPGRRRRQGGTRRRSSGGRATPASCTTRACWSTPPASQLTAPLDYAALFTNDYLP